MAESIWYLKRCDLFERLTEEDLSRIESRAKVRKFPRNSPIYLPADEADGVLLLASGRVKICHFTAEGKQAILALIEPGEIFGELALFGQETRNESAETVDASTVLLIPRSELLALMESHAHVSMGITKLIGLRRQRIERRLKSLLFRSNRDRLVHLLLELAERYGVQKQDGLFLNIRLSHQDLANIIGSTRETVTVELGRLQAEGLLKVGRQSITLLKPVHLSRDIDFPTLPQERSPDKESHSRLSPRTLPIPQTEP